MHCFVASFTIGYCPKNPKLRAVLVIRSEDPNYRTDDKRDSNDFLVRSQSSIKSEGLNYSYQRLGRVLKNFSVIANKKYVFYP